MSTAVPRALPLRRFLRTFIPALALSGVLLCLFGSSPASAACASASSTPSSLTRFAARSSVFCLINEQRAANGLPALTPSRSLGLAAEHHSRAMKARKFFGHQPDGNPARRARRAGYMAGASWWMVGEALGWGRGSTGTPSWIVAAMMGSPAHRAVLLNGTFRDIGVGVAMGAPIQGRGRNAAIYTVALGARR